MNPMRAHYSCPSCGWIFDKYAQRDVIRNRYFECPRCHTHFAEGDLEEENREKWMAQFHNSAKADLTQEETE